MDLTSKQEGQVDLNRSPEFSLKLKYRYLLMAGHVRGDNICGPRNII